MNDSSGFSLSVAASPHNGLPIQNASCSRCESYPVPHVGPGTLHMQFPLSHSRGKILDWLRTQNHVYESQSELLSVDVPHDDLALFIAPLSSHLSSTERADVRVLWQPAGAPLALTDLFAVETLQSFAARARSGWLVDMLKEDRLDTWFQPIVSCAEPKNIFGYECLMRGRDEHGVVFPDRILEIANGAGLLFQLDRAARIASIHNACRKELKGTIFINFTPTSIYDPQFCLRSTMRAIEETGIAPERIVFEVIESEDVGDAGHLRGILDYYRSHGFRVALDDVGSGYSSLNMLGALRPDFLKLDRELVSGVHADPYKATIAAKLLETAQDLEMKTVAEGIEEEADHAWLQSHGANYIQGYLFARPSAEPPRSFD
jgi:EAL domain-containing protein (putative c-di-GMP-specific phosphodiesterase class I)